MSIKSFASKLANTGKEIIQALLGGQKVPKGHTSTDPIDGGAIEQSTEVLGLIYRTLQRARVEELARRLDDETFNKDQKKLNDDRNQSLIDALTIRKKPTKKVTKPKKEEPTKVKKESTKEKTTETKTYNKTKKETDQTVLKKTSTPSTQPVTTTPSTSTSVRTTPIIPSRVATGVGVAAVAVAGAMAITKIIEVGKGYNIVQLASGETVRREGSWNWRNNNPGNIEYGEYALKHGAIPYDHGMSKSQKPEERFAVFPTYELGRKAKENLIFEGKNYKDLTIDQAIARYAPPSENNTLAYQTAVKSSLNLSSEKLQTVKMKELTPEQRSLVLSAMEKQEGYGSGKKQTTVIQKGPTDTKSIIDTGSKIDQASKENKEMKSAASTKKSIHVNNINTSQTQSTNSQYSSDVEDDDRNAHQKKK